MNAFLKNLSDFFVSLTSTEQAYERGYSRHEIELFLLQLNAQFDLNIDVGQAMELVHSLDNGQLGNITLNVLFCGCPHTVNLDCVYQSDGIAMRFKSASMPLHHAIHSALEHFRPASEVDSMTLARVA